MTPLTWAIVGSFVALAIWDDWKHSGKPKKKAKSKRKRL